MDFKQRCKFLNHVYFMKRFGVSNETLADEVYQYGRENLALMNVLIQSPFVTKIKKDVAITFTNYVANTGGLLGLCLGFSFISGMEIIFWICCCCQRSKKNRNVGSMNSAVVIQECQK